MQSYDIIVLGGGIVGAATAEALSRRGGRVLLLDQYEPGHTHGSSHGDGRVIRYDYAEPFYVEMAKLAYPLWAELSQRAGEPLIQQTGLLSMGPIDHPELITLKNTFAQTQISYQSLTAAEVNQRFPQFHLEAGAEALYQPQGGVNFATPAVKALWRLAQTNGVTTMTGQRIQEIVVQQAGVRLRSQSGESWQAGRLVLAMGSWTPKMCRNLNLELPLEVTQEQLAYFPVTHPTLSHRVGDMPVFVDYHATNAFYGIPQVDIPGVKVGWHHTGIPLAGPDERQPWHEDILQGIQEFVRQRFPHLDASAPFNLVTCLYTNTPDYHFVLDRHPDWSHIAIAAGFSGHGFKFGPLLGQIMAALALDETPPVSLAPFAISRFDELNQLQRRTGI